MAPEMAGPEELRLDGTSLPIAFFCIPTKERPANLAKCLDSYIGNFSRFGRFPDIIVSDDSTTFSARRANGKVIETHRQGYHGRIIHLNRRKRHRLAVSLAAKVDVRKGVLKFGLLGDDLYKSAYGANRNALLLLTAGHSSVQVDDDTICILGTPPGSETTTKVVASDSPFEHWFYRSAADAFAAASRIEGSFLDLHERLLGRSVSNSVKDRLLQERIVCTIFGHTGDCANQSHWRLFASGKSAERLRRSLPWGLSTRFIIGSSPLACVSRPKPFATMCVGFNTSGYLPPFMPCFRNEDGLFGRLLSRCSEQSAFGYLPYLIRHHPPGHRPATEWVFDSASPKVTLPILIEWILEAWEPGKKEVTAGGAEFGAHLRDLASLKPSAFAAVAKDVGNRNYRLQLERTETALAIENNKEIREILQQLSSYQSDILAHTDAFVPRLIHVKLRSGKSVPQDFLFRFGELLGAWPEVFAKAKGLDFSDVLA